MKSRLGLAVLAVALGASALVTLPSGAGQHFGIIGDTLAWGSDGAMQARSQPLGLPENSAQGFLIWGAGAAANDSAPSAMPITFAGCVTVTTMAGTDFGCDQDMRLPTPVFDPLMGQAHAQAQIRSDAIPGSFIIVNLTFIGTDPFLLPLIQLDDPLNAQLVIAAGRFAAVSGTVRSTALGTAQIDTNGIIAKGGAVRTCSYDGTPCG